MKILSFKITIMHITKEKISIISHGGPKGSISLTGFSEENLEKMLAAMSSGAYYIKVVDGKLETVPSWEKLPKPTEDENMLPFWRRHTESKQQEFFDEYEHSEERGHSPSITIQHLCGYNYTPENYKSNAEKLESYGFECLRSRRGIDGKFWELWFLPGLWCSKGDLRASINLEKEDDNKLRIALKFLNRRVSFGTLDVSSQRMAMVME